MTYVPLFLKVLINTCLIEEVSNSSLKPIGMRLLGRCTIIVFNELMSAYRRARRKWFIGDGELRETDSYTHLGIICHKNMHMKENVIESASKIRRILFALLT